MHDPHFFPEVQEQLVSDQGLLVPESQLSLVRFAWMVATAYLVLLAINFVYFLVDGMSISAAVFSAGELLVVLWLVITMRRWNTAAAVLICVHPIASIAFHGGGVPGLPLLGGTLGILQASTTLVIVSVIGQAAKAIHHVRRSSARDQQPDR